jgi:hypothetical protein
MPENPFEPPKAVNEPVRQINWHKRLQWFAAISALAIIGILGAGAAFILALGWAMHNDGF